MEKKPQVSHPRKGMNTDKSPIDLSETEYTFSLNSNIASETGDTFLLQDEPSNLLCLNFPEGFKVIGRVYEVNSDRTYFFLTNPDTGISEIGYSDNVNDIASVEDVERQCGCDIENILSEPLEDQEQTPTCTYVKLLNDDCNLCLGFSINYPIRKIEIKYEFSGTTLWWTDRNNTMRYLDVTNIDQYLYIGVDSCGEDNTQTTCLDCEKLRVTKQFNQPQIQAEAIQQGGRLKAGTYEALIAYSDLLGNEISSYYNNVNPVSINDENNTTIEQSQLEYETNFGIRFKVENLDTDYPYYKVAIVYSGGINGTSYYSEGVHSTSNKEITLTTLQGLQPITFAKLAIPKKVYDKADGLASSNGILYWHGTTEQEEINFQPCANLLGGFVRWITVETTENLYKEGINTSLYKSYMRDEVYPLALQLLYDNGATSADFPLISRPPTADDLSTIDNTDTQSILEYGTNCSINSRNKKWQFYNTATDEGYYGAEDLDNYNIVERETVKTCVADNVYVAETLAIDINCEDNYTTLESYIETYRDAICNVSSPQYNSELCTILSQTYDSQTCDFEELFGDTCNFPPTLVSDSVEVFLESVEQENVLTNYQDIEDTQPTPPPSICNVYKVGTNEFGYEDDTAFAAAYLDVGEVAYKRNPTGTNTACAYAFNLQPDIVSPLATYLSYQGSETITDLQTIKTSDATGDFTSFVHTKSLWYKVEFGDLDNIILEISAKSECEQVDDIPIGDNIRITYFDSCSVNTHLSSQVVDLNDGALINLQKTDYVGGVAYIAIDSPIATRVLLSGTTYVVSPPCGCFNVLSRNYQCISRTVTVEGASFSKRAQYTTLCEYKVPIDNGCTPAPYKYGKFSYWESTSTYPDNAELYNSNTLNINLANFPVEYKSEFLENYIENGQLDADFRCQPIRHFKFPDFAIAPYMSTESLSPFADSFIYPIGVSLDEDLINYFLDVAVASGLMTQAQRDRVVGYKIKAGDRTLNKSIVAKGIANDMFSYTEVGATNPTPILFPNFPYNDNHPNSLLYTNNNRNTFIPHPHSGTFNNNFTFHAPDTSFGKPTLPTELKIECHQFGHSRGNFVSVEDHVREVVLGKDAYTIATALAITEAALELLINATDFGINAAAQGYTVVIAGQSSGIGQNFGGVGVSGGLLVAYGIAAAAASFIKVGRYRKEWLDIIEGLGQPRNFASYYTSVGKYNWAVPNITTGNMLRAIKTSKYLKPGNYQFTEEVTGETIHINNRDRESSVYLSTGEDYPITNPAYYTLFDNSRTIASESTGCENTNKSSTVERQIASPYFSLKNYIPNQYGDIGDIQWINTGYTGNLNTPQNFPQIFGGDIFISRFAKKIKHPIFKTTAMDLADRTPFNYTIERNVGVPRFYADFYTTTDSGFNAALFPDIDTEYKFDCLTGSNGTYVRNPSKFYTAYCGIPYFLVESEINTNYRYAREGRENDFYPNTEDFVGWTQENTVPIRQDNTYFYNNVYSKKTTILGNRSLPIDYSSEYFRKIVYQPNNVFWSLPDNSDIDRFEPWLSYRPLDFYNFKADLGKLVDLSDIESAQVIGRFENGFLRYNSIDLLRERTNAANQELGTGGIFAQRPLEHKRTKLGYAGTQHVDMVSCEFGHFWADAKRGQVFQLDQNGEQINDITEGKTRWFKEQLPFKILRYAKNFEIDNSYNGVGLTMGWDAKYKRVFLTKKDYIPKGECIQYDPELGFVVNETLCGAEPVITCPTGYTYNEETQTCEKEITTDACPEGYTYNPETGNCEGEGSQTLMCPDGYTYDAESQTCILQTTSPAEETETEICGMDAVLVIRQGINAYPDNDRVEDFLHRYVDNLAIQINAGNIKVGVVSFGDTATISGGIPKLYTGTGASTALKAVITNILTSVAPTFYNYPDGIYKAMKCITEAPQATTGVEKRVLSLMASEVTTDTVMATAPNYLSCNTNDITDPGGYPSSYFYYKPLRASVNFIDCIAPFKFDVAVFGGDYNGNDALYEDYYADIAKGDLIDAETGTITTIADEYTAKIELATCDTVTEITCPDGCLYDEDLELCVCDDIVDAFICSPTCTIVPQPNGNAYCLCPAGEIESRCTDCDVDTDYTSCPDGYTYDQTLQKCVSIIPSCPPYEGYYAGGTFTNPPTRLYNSQNNLLDIFTGGVTHLHRDKAGYIYVAGSFNNTSEGLIRGLIRLNFDGSFDDTFDIGTGFNSQVRGIDSYPDGRIIVVGNFSTYQGQPNNGIIRLNFDGTKDTTFDNTIGFNVDPSQNVSGASVVRIVENDKILVGADKGGSYKGAAFQGIIKLLPTGVIDTTFNGGGNRFISATFDGGNGTPDGVGNLGGIVNSIEIAPSGGYYLGGRFNEYNGILSRRILKIKLNGDIDLTFNVGQGIEPNSNPNTWGILTEVTKVQMQGSKLLVGGNFFSYKGQPVQGIIRLNPNGTLDSTFNNTKNLGFQQARTVWDFDTNVDGEILIGGNYAEYDGNGIRNLTYTDVNGFALPTPNEAFNGVIFTVLNTPRCATCYSDDCQQRPIGFGQVQCQCPPLASEPTCVCIETVPAIIVDTLTPVSICDTTYFEEASWTAAYSPLTKSWVSYYSFKPNYYISHQNYFQTGLNCGESTLWSHLLTNRSYRVFYGNLYDWIVEAPAKTSLDKKLLGSIKYIVDSERFHNEYDSAPLPQIGFNQLVVWNATNNTGLINLIEEEKNNLYQKTRYPVTNTDSQDVLTTKYDDVFSVNYFFNRVRSENNNVPLWLKDNVDVEKTLNRPALTYGSLLPERMKGNWFLVRFYKTNNSNIKSIYKFIIEYENIYP